MSSVCSQVIFSLSGTPNLQMLVHLTLSQKFLKLSTFIFILFSLFCSAAVISITFSYNSLIFSSSSIILYLFLLVYFSFLLLYSSTLVGLYFSNSLLKLLITSLCIHSFPEFLNHIYNRYSELFLR